MKIDIDSPIIPWEGMGGVKLYSHISEFYGIIRQEKNTCRTLGMFIIIYEINDSVDLWFNVLNGKLFKITALKNYTGKLFGDIGIGMHIDDVLSREPSFSYDDFEEVYCSPKGVFIETDPAEHTVLWISVYVKEREYENFIRGDW